jgi:hypothetical protein
MAGYKKKRTEKGKYHHKKRKRKEAPASCS